MSATKPALKSALKKPKPVTRDDATTVAPPDATAATSSATTAAAAAEQAARIRAAAELKATQLHATVQAKQQWSSWISQVQMKLIERHVTPSTLTRAAMVLRPQEYEEVTEERATAKMCAWPGCDHDLNTAGNKLSNKPIGPPKKYHLSLKQQRVYDVTEAQSYCHEKCFMASELYKQGLEDEPFYLRQMKKTKPTSTQPSPSTTNQQATSTMDKPNEESKEQIDPAEAVSNSTTIDDSVEASFVIVEKENSVSHTFPTLPKSTAAADSLTIEGYRPKSVPIAVTNRKDDSVKTTSSTTTSTVTPPPTDAKSSVKPESTTSDNVPSVLSSSSAPSTAAASSNDPFTSQPASSNGPQFLDFTPLPTVLATVVDKQTADPAKPLSRAEFAALTPEQQMDYMGFMALQERKHIQPQAAASVASPIRPTQATSTPVISSPAPIVGASSSPVTSPAAPSSSEPKIRRRKTAAEKENDNTTTASPSQPSEGKSPNVTKVSSSSSTPTAPNSTLPKLTSQQLLCDDDSEPMITPEEIKKNMTAIRQTTLPPFISLMQLFMRWTTIDTGHFILTGRLPSSPAAQRNRQRQSAFLTMLQPYWRQLAQLFQVHRPCQRELRELSDTFSFDDPIPAMKPEHWRMITLVMMRGVTHRLCLQDQLLPTTTTSANAKSPIHAWMCIQPFSALSTTPIASSSPPSSSTAATSPTQLETLIHQTIQSIGLSMDQLDSLYHQWMLLTKDTYGR